MFQIDPDNIAFIESMTYQEKQDLINQLIYEHRENAYYDNETEKKT